MRVVFLPLVLAAACGGGLKLTLIDASVQRPSNIAVYFTVDTSSGEPVAGLTADSFRIFEDEGAVSLLESKQTILNAEVAATHYTLLLIDMSGSVTGSGDVPTIIEAARAFGERVQKYQKVGVYAFDGGPSIYPIVGFGGGAAVSSGVERLRSFRPRDPSTNLNGAVIEAIRVLHGRMAGSPTPLTFGTLAVFTDGTDRAHRVKREQLHRELEGAPGISILTIGVGAEIDRKELDTIGRDGFIYSADRAQIASVFDQAAARIESYSRRYYLLGYCSPARAGEHDLRIETSAKGRGGSLQYRFRADGFGPDCDLRRPPAFNVKRPKTAHPTEEEIEVPAPHF